MDRIQFIQWFVESGTTNKLVNTSKTTIYNYLFKNVENNLIMSWQEPGGALIFNVV